MDPKDLDHLPVLEDALLLLRRTRQLRQTRSQQVVVEVGLIRKEGRPTQTVQMPGNHQHHLVPLDSSRHLLVQEGAIAKHHNTAR